MNLNLSNHWRWIVWFAYTPAWTIALLVPRPIEVRPDQVLLWWSLFLFSKAVHVSAYALWSLMTCWLRTTLPIRLVLVLVMVLHAGASEYLQVLMNIGRHGSLRDVALDLVGIALGIFVGWRLFLRNLTTKKPVSLPPAPGEPVAMPASLDPGSAAADLPAEPAR